MSNTSTITWLKKSSSTDTPSWNFKLILITAKLPEHDQYSELKMTLRDHKECLSATYNSTLFRHGHLSSLLWTGKGSDCLLHSAERSQSSCVNPQRAEELDCRVCVCVQSRVTRITRTDVPVSLSQRNRQRFVLNVFFILIYVVVLMTRYFLNSSKE